MDTNNTYDVWTSISKNTPKAIIKCHTSNFCYRNLPQQPSLHEELKENWKFPSLPINIPSWKTIYCWQSWERWFFPGLKDGTALPFTDLEIRFQNNRGKVLKFKDWWITKLHIPFFKQYRKLARILNAHAPIVFPWKTNNTT